MARSNNPGRPRIASWRSGFAESRLTIIMSRYGRTSSIRFFRYHPVLNNRIDIPASCLMKRTTAPRSLRRNGSPPDSAVATKPSSFACA